MVDKKIDTILVTAIAGLTPAAFYAVAKQISEACVSPASSLGYTISPAFGEDKAGDRLKRAARLYEYSLEHILIFYIPATVGLILVAEPTMRHVVGNVSLNLLLIPIYGATGAAAASVVTFGTYTLLNVYIITTELPIQFGRVTGSTGRIVLIAGIMGVSVRLLLPYVTGIGTLVAVIGVGGGIWLALSVVWGVIDIEQLWSYVMPSSSSTE